MKYYDLIVSLGHWCAASEALRRCHLQDESLPFDWSGGILTDICGKGGLEGKINLICNNFEDYFNLEDLENRGPNEDADFNHYWVVNKKTGIQYKHDFPADQPIERSYHSIKEKYDKRIKRLYTKIASSEKILFVFISNEEGYNDEYLCRHQERLSKRFLDKKIDFLYILHLDCDPKEIKKRNLNSSVCRVDLNFLYSNHKKEDEWRGNFDLYSPFLKNYCYSPVTLDYYRNCFDKMLEIIQNQDKNIQILIEKNNELMKIAELISEKKTYCFKMNNFLKKYLKKLKEKSLFI